MSMNTGSLQRLLAPGLKSVFDVTVKNHPDFNAMMYKTERSKKAYEVSAQVTNLGLLKAKSEGAAIQYDSMAQGYIPKFVHTTYALGIEATEELIADEQYKVLEKRSAALARSAMQTMNTLGASVLVNGFDTNYTMVGGDGKPLFSATHVAGPNGGTYSNLGTPADLSESTLEDLLIQIKGATDARGLKVPLIAQKLIIPANYSFIAARILNSQLQSGTANNATNAIRDSGLLSGGIVENVYLGDVDAWFVTTDAQEGLIQYIREDVTFKEDVAFSTGSSRYKASFRASWGWADAHGCYGNAG